MSVAEQPVEPLEEASALNDEKSPTENDNQSFTRATSIFNDSPSAYRGPSIRRTVQFKRMSEKEQPEEQPYDRKPAPHNILHRLNMSNLRMKHKTVISIIAYIISIVMLVTIFIALNDRLKAYFQDELSKSRRMMADELSNLKDELRMSNKLIAYQKTELTNLKGELHMSNKLIADQKIELSNIKKTSSEVFNRLHHQNADFSKKLNIELSDIKDTQDVLKKSISTAQSCQQLLANGQFRNGVYTITGTGTPFDAYCNQKQGGYMVFQRRFDGSTDFRRDYQTYVDGFGNVDGEYWLGLENLHQYTKGGRHQLRVDLVGYDDTTTYALYRNFSIGAGPGYQLHVGWYSGTAGDSLAWHNNMKFSTYDHDADISTIQHCADEHQGAFWYRSCAYANLNAFDYTDDLKHGKSLALSWNVQSNIVTPLKETTMMVL